MNTHYEADLWQVLALEQEALIDGLARDWVDRHAVPLDLTELRLKFARWWEQVLPLLADEAWEPEMARRLGAELAHFPDAQPEDWGAWQKALGEYVAARAAAFLPALLPRLTAVLAESGAGFHKERARLAARFNMEAMSHMGHDLKTPINSVIGFSKVILKGIDGPITEFQEQDLTSIYEGGQNLLTMINDIFQTAKLDAEKTGLWPEPYEVPALVADVWATAQSLVGRTGLHFTIQSQGELGKVSLDASRLRWVLLCLLYMAAGKQETGEVVLRVAPKTEAGKTQVCFAIQGPGQPPQLASPSLRLVMAQNFSAQLGGELIIERHDEHGLQARVCFPQR